MLGRVLKFHAHDASCDLQLLADGSQLTGVPVLSGMVSTSSGRVDVHEPEGSAYDKPGSTTRDVYAVVGWAGPAPLVVGFLAPQVSQVLFDRANFRVDRHASDVYSTIDKDGNVELAHPSGTFVRIATSPDHEDLTGQDFDARWAITRNTTKNVWLSIAIANAGGVKATLKIDPSGNVSLTNAGTLQVSASGAATLTASSLTINAPVAILGSSLTHNGVNVGQTHKHSGVAAGPANTGNPI